MTQVVPDPRPVKRIKATREEWGQIRREKFGPCRVCGDGRVSAHHLVGRDLSGDDVAENIVFLCGHGTFGCHGLVEHRDPVACGKLRASLTEPELLYVANKKGWDFLDRYYSPLGEDGGAAGGAVPVLAERDVSGQPSRSASTCPTCKQPLKLSGSPAEPDVEKREPRRRKKRYVVTVPDDHEDGAEILRTLAKECAKEIPGYDENTPDYFVWAWVGAAFLRGENGAAA